MMQSIQNNPNVRSCCASHQVMKSEKRADESLVKKVSAFMQNMVEYTAEVLLDFGRGMGYVCDWTEHASSSISVKDSASKVKQVVDRFNIVGVFCEMTMATRDIMTKQAENVAQAVNLVGAYVASTAEFAGRLTDLNVISVSKKVATSVGTAGSFAEASLGLNGIREGVQDLKEGKSVSASLLKIAKNTALLAIGILSAISVGFVSVAASFPKLSICILTSATAYLALKTALHFHEAMAAAPPSGVAHSV